jgi:hypothetical protein
MLIEIVLTVDPIEDLFADEGFYKSFDDKSGHLIDGIGYGDNLHVDHFDGGDLLLLDGLYDLGTISTVLTEEEDGIWFGLHYNYVTIRYIRKCPI